MCRELQKSRRMGKGGSLNMRKTGLLPLGNVSDRIVVEYIPFVVVYSHPVGRKSLSVATRAHNVSTGWHSLPALK